MIITMHQLSMDDISEPGMSILVPRMERLHYAGRILSCHRCGADILVGSWYKRKAYGRGRKGYGRGGSKTKYYHLMCWRDLWLEL